MSKTDRSTAKGPAAELRAALVLADGTCFEGHGFGADAQAVGEVCFNTAMTGYEEVLTDPSYAGQIVSFTFPHIGIVGTNEEDIGVDQPGRARPHRARGRDASVELAQSRHAGPLAEALQHSGDQRHRHARTLAWRIREKGMPHGVIASGTYDIAALKKAAQDFSGLEGLDLAKDVSARQTSKWQQTPWQLGKGYGEQDAPSFRAVVIDYGVKRNILRELAGVGADITVVPANATLEDVMKLLAVRRGALQRARRSGRDGRIRDPDDPGID